MSSFSVEVAEIRITAAGKVKMSQNQQMKYLVKFDRSRAGY